MYSVRKTTQGHGDTNIKVLLFIVTLTAVLIWQFGLNYLVIFCTSSIMHLTIETGLAFSGIRKGAVYAFGFKLPLFLEILLRSMVEGPAFCVPAFFVADQFIKGDIVLGITAALIVVGLASLYMGLADRHNLRNLKTEEEPIISRRAMTRPKAMMFLALINTICLSALFLIPAPYRLHAFIYLIAYCVLVMVFYFINYNLGVRVIEIYDHDSKEYNMPGPIFQAVGLTYTSIYEMAFLITPAYWLTFYLGLFNY